MEKDNSDKYSTKPQRGGSSISHIQAEVQQASAWVHPLQSEMAKVIVGQKQLINRLLVGLIANGHILLEGVPGLAKTLTLRTLSSAVKLHFQRIQFTPDMLPADIVGTLIYNPSDSTFQTRQGPIFSNLVLADEINRAPAKVQSALLEAMQERQVTIGDRSYQLPDPFLVLATQNPVEQEGTYPLPEAQVDRFMLKVIVTYPSRQEERAILEAMASTSPNLQVNPFVTSQEIIKAREVVNMIYMDDKVKDYIVDIIASTRNPADFDLEIAHLIQYGASPRATINLALASKAQAFLQGRAYVTPQDVKSMAFDVLRHRISVTYEAEAEEITSESIVQKILDTLPVP